MDEDLISFEYKYRCKTQQLLARSSMELGASTEEGSGCPGCVTSHPDGTSHTIQLHSCLVQRLFFDPHRPTSSTSSSTPSDGVEHPEEVGGRPRSHGLFVQAKGEELRSAARPGAAQLCRRKERKRDSVPPHRTPLLQLGVHLLWGIVWRDTWA